MAGGGNGRNRVWGESVELTYTVHHGDCLAIMPTLAENSVDAIVTDSPYGLEFMGKDWDHGVPGVHFWQEAIRVAKPGAHLLAFGGSRTFHRLAVAIEDAGWEMRDTIMWVYGSGFPKSLDVSKAIDAAAGAEREVKRTTYSANMMMGGIGVKRPWKDVAAQNGYHELPGNIPATPEAAVWQGWGTNLKPSHEPIIVARKPLDGTVAANVLKWGTGAINVDGCRVGTAADMNPNDFDDNRRSAPKFSGILNGGKEGQYRARTGAVPNGRWPANLVHDGSEEVLRLFPNVGKSTGGGGNKAPGKNGIYGTFNGHQYDDTIGYGDTGSAARFFYCAKASKADRDEGLEGWTQRQRQGNRPNSKDDTGKFPDHDHRVMGGNFHPTVKPTSLMRWLVRLVTPPNGVILDPFTGSGSTGKAAMLEGFRFIGIEQDAEYCEIARARIGYAVADRAFGLFDLPEHDDRAMAAD